MPDQTPLLNLPYPLDSDPVDVARDIEKLAEAIDDSAGPGGAMNGLWVNQTGDTMTGNLVLASEHPLQSVTLRSGRTDMSNNTPGQPSLVINRTLPAAVADVDIFIRFDRGDTQIGSIRVDSFQSVSYLTTSDARLKDEIGPVGDGLALVERLRPIEFTWKGDTVRSIGFLAHEVQGVVPTAVTGEKDGVLEDGAIDPQQLDSAKLIPILVAAVQELSARVAELEGGQ